MEEDELKFPKYNPSVSQEEELRTCGFARESEQFLDSDSQSTWISSSQPTAGIIMESPPDSDPNNQAVDKFHTPPEFPISDNLKSTPPDGCDCVIKDHQTEVVGSEFDENGDFGGEIVSTEITEKVGIYCDMSTQETENVDNEMVRLDSEETVALSGDDETVVSHDNKVVGRVGLEEKGCLDIIHDIVKQVAGCEFDEIGISDREFMSQTVLVREEELELGVGKGCVGDMKHIENTALTILDSEEHAEGTKLSNENLRPHLDLVKNDTCEGKEVSKRMLLGGDVGDDKGLNVLSGHENVVVDGDGEVRDSCQDINGIEIGGHKDVNLQKTGKRKLGGSDKINLEKSKEDIEKFKYVKPGDGVEGGKDEDQRGEDESVSGQGNDLPLSKTGKGPLCEVGQGSVTKGNISFMEFVNRAAELLKREVDSDTEVDLIETAKKKGMKFPRPRWYPPEGFN